jgi:hypothetical protein
MLALLAALTGPAAADPAYPWRPGKIVAGKTLAAMIAPPEGFVRLPQAPGSFGAWLRGLPMKPPGAGVMLYDGRPKGRDDTHHAVVDIDVGAQDLQQCADAVMRLRAEWLRATGRAAEIAFDYTSGARVDYARWAKGLRPSPTGKGVTWSRKGQPGSGYASFRRYLDQVFSYAGTYSLARELAPVASADIAIGDVYIEGGFPGHAVLVADMAINAAGEKRVLLVQSYMPAQDIHVLRNPASAASPWYAVPLDGELVTPEWTFDAADLKRWP